MLAYLLDLISEYEKDALSIVGKIRNRFAHDIKCNSFNIKRISDECDLLAYSVDGFRNSLEKRNQKLKNDKKLNGKDKFEPIFDVKSTPQNKFMVGVSYLMGFFESKLDAYELAKESGFKEGILKKIISSYV